MKNQEKPIIAICGVGGAGKNSVMEIFKKYPDRFSFFVSYTDRPQREDDIPGESYHFISQEEFSKAINNNEFMEWEATRGEFRYGRKKEDLDKIIRSGQIPVMNIDVKGAVKFKKLYKVISFFIVPPSKEEALRRMIKRGTDSEEGVKDRINRYDLEMGYKDQFDYVIVNDDLEMAQKELLKIVNSLITS
ncbi:MAG: guanylate kinase [Patescibacteria group bacterium]|nr:guanylate kinase [Patescibacteria group bacterium]